MNTIKEAKYCKILQRIKNINIFVKTYIVIAKKKGKFLKSVAYCRVSTDNQKEERTIQVQIEEINRFAVDNGYDIEEFFKDEAVSGGKDLDNRPELSRLFDYLENNEVAYLIIYKLDRLARDLYIQEHLIKKLEKLNVKLISTKEIDLDSSDPMRKAFRQFMGIVSELEKSFITMRLSGGRISKAQKGKYAGGRIALGYKNEDGSLIKDKEKIRVIEKIFKYKSEGLSLRQIASLLNEQSIKTARGGKWYAGTIKYILDNPIYQGQFHYKNVVVERNDLALAYK